MTPAEINVAIAQWRGWTKTGLTYNGNDIYTNGNIRAAYRHAPADNLTWMPDYCSDLNHIAQAEARLTLAQREPYQQWLYRICEREHRMAPIYWLAITATALQRSTALLHAVGLWKEEA